MAESPSIPPPFVDLTAAFEQDNACNIIGIVVDFLPAAPTSGPDWTIKFTLHDQTWYHGSGLEVRYFGKREELLPAVKNTGDVVILRNLKFKLYSRNGQSGGQRYGLSNTTTTWVVLDSQSISDSTDESGRDIKVEKLQVVAAPRAVDLQYAKWLHRHSDPATFQQPQGATALQVEGIIQASGGTAPARREKFRLLQDLVVPDEMKKVFCDILGEVRRVFRNDFRVELYVTDYTSHEALYNYVFEPKEEGTEGDRFGYANTGLKAWPGPWGRMTLQVTLWDENAAFAHQEVSEGDYVLLTNVSIKSDSTSARLEGHCRGDRHNSTRVHVLKMAPRDAASDGRMMDLLRRRKEYEKRARSQDHRFLGNLKARKRLAEGNPEVTQDETEGREEGTFNPQTGRKKKKKERKRARKGPCAAGADVTVQKAAAPLAPNTNVRCVKIDVPFSTVNDIMDMETLNRTTPKGNHYRLPFQNCCYKSKVRVVEFLPHDLADFCQPHRESMYHELDIADHDNDIDSDPELTQSGEAEVNWEWRFALVVEDPGPPGPNGPPKGQMVLVVAGGDGDHLLNLDACDLRKHPSQLQQLKNKLWVLWGDLQERKAEASPGQDYGALVQSRPFECLIKEYGVRTRDETGTMTKEIQYERMFGLFKTAIK